MSKQKKFNRENVNLGLLNLFGIFFSVLVLCQFVISSGNEVLFLRFLM